jgi:putative FmdB family regulatory protein
MPIYEFRCQTCHRKASFLVRSITDAFTPVCPACGGSDLVRTISSFAYHKSLATIWENSGEPTRFPGPDYYKDPRNIGRWAEKRFQEMGMEMPDQVQEMIQAAREGELPEPLKDLKGATPDAAYH